MKTFKKFILSAGLAIGLSMVYAVPAKATATGDLALLLQQVSQYFQDWDFDKAKWNDVTRKVNEARQIVNQVGVKSKTVNSVFNISSTMASTLRELDEAVSMVKATSWSDFEITRIYNIYRAFYVRGKSILDDSAMVVLEIQAMKIENPVEASEFIQKKMKEFEDQMNFTSQEAKDAVKNLKKKSTQDKIRNDNNNSETII